MTHASLFSGVGGFDLAAEWAGWTNMFNCEIDPFCRRVLAYHFPNAVQYEDIRTTDFTVWRGKIDVLTGGFPCQPFSIAGLRKGTDDDRYLWPEMLRAIREIRPRWVVGENVRGFVNWSEGMVLDTVFADLEALGYEVQPFILPACAVGAPHRRDRVWIVAHRADAGAEGLRERQEQAYEPGTATDAESDGCGRPRRGARCESVSHRVSSRKCKGGEVRSAVVGLGREQIVADADARDYRRIDKQQQIPQGAEGESGRNTAGCDKQGWENFPTQPPVRSGNDGLSTELDGITFPKWRMQSIKAYGNAIVPQVFYHLAETINEYERV